MSQNRHEARCTAAVQGQKLTVGILQRAVIPDVEHTVAPVLCGSSTGFVQQR